LIKQTAPAIIDRPQKDDTDIHDSGSVGIVQMLYIFPIPNILLRDSDTFLVPVAPNDQKRKYFSAEKRKPDYGSSAMGGMPPKPPRAFPFFQQNSAYNRVIPIIKPLSSAVTHQNPCVQKSRCNDDRICHVSHLLFSAFQLPPRYNSAAFHLLFFDYILSYFYKNCKDLSLLFPLFLSIFHLFFSKKAPARSFPPRRGFDLLQRFRKCGISPNSFLAFDRAFRLCEQINLDLRLRAGRADNKAGVILQLIPQDI
jgi:hypothetical protein